MLTLLTTTGCRPQAFEICEYLMRRQTHDGPVHWIVVDDGEDPQPMGALASGWTRKVIRPRPFWRHGDNTQGRNLRAGLAEARRHEKRTGAPLKLVIIEDDDWYDPFWLDAVNEGLRRADLYGENAMRFYNIAFQMFRETRRLPHAVLRASAMRGPAIDLFETIIDARRDPPRGSRAKPPLYDMDLWRAVNHERRDIVCRLTDSDFTIGVKAMPGRGGIAGGHDGRLGRYDRGRVMFKKWFGGDCPLYAHWIGGVDMNGEKKMRALQAMKYRTRRLQAGEEFLCTPKHARAFRAMNWAEPVLEAPKPRAEPTPTEKTLAQEPPRAPRRRRRASPAVAETPAPAREEETTATEVNPEPETASIEWPGAIDFSIPSGDDR